MYLVNTDWTGGSYNKGGRKCSISITRSIIDAILSGEILKKPTEVLLGFNFNIPIKLKEIDSTLLDPKLTWENTYLYEKEQRILIEKFKDNFNKFNQISETIKQADPK